MFEEVLLEVLWTVDLLLDLLITIDEVFEFDLFVEGFFEVVRSAECDKAFLVLDVVLDDSRPFKTHLQACLTAGTFRFGIGES